MKPPNNQHDWPLGFGCRKNDRKKGFMRMRQRGDSRKNCMAFIQARMNSGRLPGKVLRLIDGRPMIERIYSRVSEAKNVSGVVVLVGNTDQDKELVSVLSELNIPCFVGSEKDVLDRFYQAAKCFRADCVIRLTGDCPFVDPDLIDQLCELVMLEDADFAGIATGAGVDGGRADLYPDGMDSECFTFDALEQAWRSATRIEEREHVTPFIWSKPNIYEIRNLVCRDPVSNVRLVVDYEDDLAVVEAIFKLLHSKGLSSFRWTDLRDVIIDNPEIFQKNQAYIGCEGYRDLKTKLGIKLNEY